MRNDGRKRIPIQVAEAVERVMKYAKHGEVEEISITESYGRILGEDVVSDHDVPHFDRSLTMVSAFEQKIRKKQLKRIQLNLK